MLRLGQLFLILLLFAGGVDDALALCCPALACDGEVGPEVVVVAEQGVRSSTVREAQPFRPCGAVAARPSVGAALPKRIPVLRQLDPLAAFMSLQR